MLLWIVCVYFALIKHMFVCERESMFAFQQYIRWHLDDMLTFYTYI